MKDYEKLFEYLINIVKIAKDSNGNIFQIKENSYTKKENSFMEYKLKEKTVSRNINNDRVFPKVIEKQLTEITKDDKMVNRLLTIRGCGKITAWTIRAYTEDITRFASAKKYVAFCGLVPWVQDSNETIHHGKITKRGLQELRTSFVQLVLGIRRCKDTSSWRMMQRYEYMKKNKGSGKSIIATARKMAEIVWAMLSDNKILIQVK